jgi:hypothetical protein
MKLTATIIRSVEADMQAELRHVSVRWPAALARPDAG